METQMVMDEQWFQSGGCRLTMNSWNGGTAIAVT